MLQWFFAKKNEMRGLNAKNKKITTIALNFLNQGFELDLHYAFAYIRTFKSKQERSNLQNQLYRCSISPNFKRIQKFSKIRQ